MKTIKLPCYNIVVKLHGLPGNLGTITSDLTEYDGVNPETSRAFDVATETVERFVLASACADIDIESPAFLEAIETVIDAVSNKYGD